MSLHTSNNISFGKNLYMTSEKTIGRAFPEIGEKILPTAPEIKKIAEKTDTDIFVKFEKYWYASSDKNSDYVEILVQKTAKNAKQSFKNFVERLNGFAMKNRAIYFPNGSSFNSKAMLEEIKVMAERLSKIKI